VVVAAGTGVPLEPVPERMSLLLRTLALRMPHTQVHTSALTQQAVGYIAALAPGTVALLVLDTVLVLAVRTVVLPEQHSRCCLWCRHTPVRVLVLDTVALLVQVRRLSTVPTG
jgi:hypothetical protein